MCLAIARQKERCMRGAGLVGRQDGGESFVPTPGGLLDGLPAADTGSSLHMFMEPKDIATIPGLPQHVYDDAARYEQGQRDTRAAAGDQRVAQAVTNGQSG